MFDLSFGSAAVKIYPFATLCWVNKDENMQSNKFSQPIGHYICQLLKTNLLSETIVTQAQTAFVCSNSAIITAE